MLRYLSKVVLISLLASCSSDLPIKRTNIPYKICSENQIPEADGCVREKPSAKLTIRGHNEAQ